MNPQDIRQLEGAMLQGYDRDGMLETLMGFGLAFGGMNLIEHGGAATGLLPLFLILAARAWKRKITYPRLGYAEIHSDRRRQKKRVILLALLTLSGIAGLAFIAALAGGAIQDAESFFGQPHAKLVFGAFLSAIIVGVAIVQRAPLFYAAAAILSGLIAAFDKMQISGGYALVLTGALLFIAGLARLFLFLRANPRLAGSASDAD